MTELFACVFGVLLGVMVREVAVCIWPPKSTVTPFMRGVIEGACDRFGRDPGEEKLFSLSCFGNALSCALGQNVSFDGNRLRAMLVRVPGVKLLDKGGAHYRVTL